MQESKQQDFTKLTSNELDEQFETILHFLSVVHPSLSSEESYKPCVEIRPIVRGEQNFSLMRSCNIWDLSEKSVARLRAFLKKHNGAPTCLFYSIFTYNNNMVAKTADGKTAKPGHITTASAVDTSEIVLDFDHIGFEEYTQLVDRFEDLGLYALWVFTGHGYHAHLLLDNALTDKGILHRLVYKFRAKGFDCDTACVDPARVMRLPGTFNKKYLKDANYAAEAVSPPRCNIVQESSERYGIEFILEALDTLPTVSTEDEVAYLEDPSAKATPPPKASNKATKSAETSEAADIIRKIEYPYLSEFDLPEPIQKILSYTPYGFRNKALGFLIKILKTHFKLGKSQIEEVLTIWSQEACDPIYDKKEFKADFTRLYYNYNGLGYSSELARRFGSLDMDHIIQLRKQDIAIPNKLFRSMNELDGTAVRLYLGIKMLEHQGTAATQAALSELLNISTRALRPTIQALEKCSFVYRVSGNRKLGIPFSYKSSLILNKSDGFMSFSYNDIRSYVTELYEEGSRANGALKLFLFFRYKFYSGDIYMSQETLGKHLGVHRTAICKMVDKLEELHFIKVTKVRRSFMESCEYTILR